MSKSYRTSWAILKFEAYTTIDVKYYYVIQFNLGF